MLKWRSNLALALILPALLLLLGGCAAVVDQVQPAADPAAALTLKPGVAVGQTFVAQHAGLNGVDFSLRALGERPVTVQAHLRADPASADDLAAAVVTVEPGEVFSPHRFSFPAQADSHNAYRYILLTVSDGEVLLEAGPGRSYLNGSVHVNGQPVEGQARFALAYAPVPMLAETARAALDALRLLAVTALIWVLPGVALLSLCLSPTRRRALSFVELITLGAGVGVALYPVLMLWAATARLALGPALVWGLAAVSLIALVVQAIAARRLRGLAATAAVHAAPRARASDAVFFLALFAIVFTRLLVIRTLDGPSWGDSVQHAVMAQRMVEQGGLFDNWLPYAPYASLTIQYGFAANTAALQRVLGIDGAQATLLAGQLLSALAVFALYPLAVRIAGGNRWAGVFAVIVAGLLSPMPAFYVNWGRYAQLTGQVVLPVALWLLWESVEQQRFQPAVTFAAGVALAGMMLSYYRMPYNYAVFALVWLLFWAIPYWGRDGRRWLGGIGRLAGVAAVALALALPWAGRLLDSSLADAVESGLASSSRLAPVLAQLQQWQGVTEYAPLPLIIAGAAALLWALIRRRPTALMLGPWILLMAALVAARLVKLPGANLLQTFAVMIMLYIPLSLLIGWFAADVLSALAKRTRVAEALAVTLALVAIGFGSLAQLRIVKPEFVYVTRPDTQAMAWIKANTPPEAVFLAEGYRIYDGKSAVGADAGWWIPLLGSRANTMPPQYALMNEKPIAPDYSRQVVDLIAQLEQNPPGSDRGLAALRDFGVTHVYVGQTQGETGMFVRRLFSPEDLLADPHFRVIYHRDRVFIFELTSS